MRKKHAYALFFIVLFLPMIHLFDNHIATNLSPLPPSIEEEEVGIAASNFAVKVHIGDPFSSPYSSFEFNPYDDVLITGAVKNLASSGAGIEVQLWLVESTSPYIPVRFLQSFTGSVPLGTSATFAAMNGSDIIWNVGNEAAGTYRILAEVYYNQKKVTSAISAKSLVLLKTSVDWLFLIKSRTVLSLAAVELLVNTLSANCVSESIGFGFKT